MTLRHIFSVLFCALAFSLFSCSNGDTGTDDDALIGGDDGESDISDASDISDDDLSDQTDQTDQSDQSDEMTGDEDSLLSDIDETPDDAPCTATFSGIYEITGEDSLGTYSGIGEIRESGLGSAALIRTIIYDDLQWNGYRTAQAMEGIIGSDYRGMIAYFKLDMGGFVKTVNGLDRPTPEFSFSGVSGDLLKTTACGGYHLATTPASPATEGGFSEAWVWREASGTDPLWKNERVETPANDEPSDTEKVTINQTYASFHALPAVQPYTDRDEFKKMVHYMVTDPTDRSFLRDNPDTVRVIQRPVNDWTLAEAEMRRNAFAYSLADKAEFFSDLVQEKMINELGMMSHWNEATQRYDQDGDSLEWTGVHVATMAWKYLIDDTQESLDRMIKSLEGIIMCVEIVPDVTTFARTVRIHVDDGDPEFHEGTGAFAGIDWKEGGNNDMFKGFVIGYYWGWLVLKDSADPRAAGLIDRMMNTLRRLHDNCPIAQDLRTNQLVASLLLYVMSEGKPLWAANRAVYKNECETIWTYVSEYIQQGGMPINEYGISDWSGNHLGLWEFFVMREAYAAAGDGTRESDMKASLGVKGAMMRPARQGLFQLIVGERGDPQSPEDIASGIERLQEVPMERGLYAVDRLWDPDFCLSPIPELFWKNDWTSPTEDRTQSLRAYPLYEMGTSNYYWKDNIYKGLRGGAGAGGDTGLDFLAGYWFARRYDLITEND